MSCAMPCIFISSPSITSREVLTLLSKVAILNILTIYSRNYSKISQVKDLIIDEKNFFDRIYFYSHK